MSPIQIESGTSAKVNLKYALVVFALLVLIGAVLAQLWLIERNRRITAENRLAEFYLKEDLLTVAKTLEAKGQAAEMLQPVRRKALPIQEVTWNGQLRSVLLLSAAMGKAMGFAPGDIILVTSEPPPAATRDAPSSP